MFGSLKNLGSLASLLTNPGKIREEMEKFQQRMGHVVAEGDAGGGTVKVRISGRMEVQACTLTDEAIKLNDREMLEDMIRAATNQALQKVRQMVAEETAKMATEMGLPAGMELPMPGGTP
jgi:DNA-binding YbaB/EbfC family protein